MRIPRTRWSAHVEFEPRDLWIGVYWRADDDGYGRTWLGVYVCLIPTLPLVLERAPRSWYPDLGRRRTLRERIADFEQRFGA